MRSSVKRRTAGGQDESLTEFSAESPMESSLSRSTEGSSTEEAQAPKADMAPLSVKSPVGWPIRKADAHRSSVSADNDDEKKPQKASSKLSEMEMMKERFSKLLLGEDMSGSGKGVSTALAISNAITNLCATIFGQLWRLEPLPEEKRTVWRREMEWILCVGDHIIELIPSWQTFPDGSKLEVMTCRPRSDIFVNLPALRKLDNMLLEILDSFKNTEFWYVDQGIVAPEADGSASFRKMIQRQEEKWWLPVPRVPAGGLSQNSRKQLNHTRDCTSQILKAAMAINASALSEMEVPDSYLEALPKSGKVSLGDVIYRYITSDHFSAECLLDCLDLSSEHMAVEIANRAEASMYIWGRRGHQSKPPNHPSKSMSKSSWEMVKDLVLDGDKRAMLAERAESLLLCLKQRFPTLSQTSLDTTKIQYNKDVGKSILESYSRVLESLAFNIVARIDDLLYVDDLTKESSNLSSVPTVSIISQPHKKLAAAAAPYSLSLSSTPYKPTFNAPSFSPAPPLISPAKVERTPFISNNSTGNNRPHRRGLGVKRVLTSYLGVEMKQKSLGNSSIKESCSLQTLN
ncbi:hypothetical protein SAY87_001145 [Trapa incisa]|uniref:PRONE domain-containing protein n=1 Tax=Trapa incisa TaxID=236973 RepID=A0AAN7GSM7_9MYRT|nr:hypothetical protein SAY87_001145 [Trapa incisa]